MDETQENQESQSLGQEPSTPQTPDVGFPLSSPKPKGSAGKWIFIVLGLVILIGGAIFLFSRASKKQEAEISPTPEVGGFATETPTPTGTAAPVNKAKVTIEVQNGTGIAGEAAYLQGVLKNLGYSSITLGNATTQDNTTTSVTFAKTLSSQVVGEITKKLEEIYKNVDTKTSSTLKTDVLIVTGLKKGATPKPTATATPTATSPATPTQ